MRSALLGAAAAVMLLLATPTAPAAAGQRLVKPAKLVPLSNRQTDLRDPLSVRSGGDYDSQFWAPVNLPAGAVIRKIRYQHASDGGFTTQILLVRTRPDAAESIQTIVSASSSDDTGSDLEFAWVASPNAVGAKARVQPGWRYAVMVVSSSDHAAIGKIAVLY